ncbi:Uncharacterised protein [uncultured Clostridium sp.]|nr:Uncharacterised protein [uncultured Clostridium sp.]
MMSFEEFVEEVVKGVADAMGHEYEVTARTVSKNNGITLTGVVIVKKGSKVTPAIYLDEKYRSYVKEKNSIKMTIEWVMNVYHAQRQDVSLISAYIGKLEEYKNVNRQVVFKLVNTRKNRELLKRIPSIPYMDLSVVFYLYLGSCEGGMFTILISNQLLDMWKVTKERMYEDAMKNTPRLLPETFRELEEVIEEMRQEESADCNPLIPAGCLEEDNPKRYVLTNWKKIAGAACLLYPGVLKKCADQLESDLVIVPSSTNELMILPYDETIDIDEIRCVLQWINMTELPVEERLSGQVYLYRRMEEQVMIAA